MRRNLPPKDPRGDALIRKLCIPRNPTKGNKSPRLTPQSDPLLFSQLYQYNLQDIASEAALSAACPALSKTETELWLLDQEINTRGVAIDTVALDACIAIVEQAREKYTAELQTLTGGAVKTVDELAKIQGWLAGRGVPLDSVDSDHIKKALKRTDIPQDVRRVMEIRSSLGARSVKKLFSIKNRLCADGRIRDLFAFCGADRTGRFAGRGPQPQNLPNSGPASVFCPYCNRIHGSHLHTGVEKEWGLECVEAALIDILTKDLAQVEYYWGDAVAAVSGCLRGLFIAEEGKDLLCSDYSAIEAVVLAAIAGEEWRLEIFRTHGKIYEASASKITGLSFEEIVGHKEIHGTKHPMRKLGKVAELASGYGGWIGAWKNFGADKFLSDEEIKQNILRWRDDSPAIVELWGGQYREHPTKWEFIPELFGIEGTVVTALLNPGKCYAYRGIAYCHDTVDDVLYCQLPSGRRLNYHQPRLEKTYDTMRNIQKYDISYMGHNSDYRKGPVGWGKLYTYSGKLVENIIQATARDILTHAMPALDRAGYPLVLHVHDEPVAEVPKGFGTVEEFERIMVDLPPWCEDWPIRAAGGWRGLRYRK